MPFVILVAEVHTTIDLLSPYTLGFLSRYVETSIQRIGRRYVETSIQRIGRFLSELPCSPHVNVNIEAPKVSPRPFS